MPKLKEDVIETKYFFIGQAAKKIDRFPGWIRWQLQQFPDFIGPVRQKVRDGRKSFSIEQVEKLKIISEWTQMSNDERIKAYTKSLKE